MTWVEGVLFIVAASAIIAAIGIFVMLGIEWYIDRREEKRVENWIDQQVTELWFGDEK